ncbi:MAG: tetratricopeptide repeat protein, partial [Alphaproteobacteria bacterium]
MDEKRAMSEQESSRQTDTDLRSVLERATALANSGDLKAAEALFREALERDPKTIEAHAFLAALAFRQGRYRDAVRAYQTCIDIQPDQPAFHANLATVRELTRDMKGAA